MSRRKDSVDIPRVKVWVEHSKLALGVKSLYALEQRLEPDAFSYESESGKVENHRNKWRRYWKDGVEPRRKLIEYVETKAPGSRERLTDPCWTVLRALASDDQDIQPLALLRMLPPGILKQLFAFGGESDGVWRRRPLTERTIKRLERRDDIAGLATLSILVVEAQLSGKGHLALELGGALFYALVRLPFGRDRALAAAAPELFKLLCERVFPRARSNTRQLCVEKVNFSQLVELVGLVLDSRDGSNGAGCQRNQTLDMLFDTAWSTSVGFLQFLAPYQELRPAKKAPKEQTRICDMWVLAYWDNAYQELTRQRGGVA